MKKTKKSKYWLSAISLCLLAALFMFMLLSNRAGAGPLAVENGAPLAEIVIAEQPARTVRLAAHDLSHFLEKISGAGLPIVFHPTEGVPVQIYIGRSDYTDRLGINPEGLTDGAYRIVARDNWLVLMGDDTDFVPTEPWARNNGQIVSGWLQQAWEERVGEIWGVPGGGMYKNRLRLPPDLGLPEGVDPGPDRNLEIWAFDGRGSYNAVCDWLRRLGVRWYMPGEIGEVVPRLPSINLPRIDEFVRPDFPLRQFNFRFSVLGPEASLWAMRLGLRDDQQIQIAHGLSTMTNRREIFDKYPEWFALYRGERRFTPGGNNQLCYSSPSLFEHTVRYARAQFDTYPLKSVSIMPPDGYTAICQCPLCAGKDTPEREERGQLSDYIWDFVNRVAREVAKTHPDRLILNCAYGRYRLPPENIDKLEPNIQVMIVGGRRPMSNSPEEQAAHRELRESWLRKTDRPLMIFENYPFTGRGWYLPAFTPMSLGDSVSETKGKSMGEDIWMTISRDFATRDIGFNHFPVYFTARMYWGGPQQDVRDLFDEYCRLFYGPAGDAMRTFFEYCEANWQRMAHEKQAAEAVLELFEKARGQVEPESIYAQRLDLIDQFLSGLRRKAVLLGQERGNVPTLRQSNDVRGPIVIDGRLDETDWEKCWVSATVGLREMQTGSPATLSTQVKSFWRGNNLYFGILCREIPGEPLNVTATTSGDPAIMEGDLVELLLETDMRSYYQIAVNPAGAVFDQDRSGASNAWHNWASQCEVATTVADDHWIVEMRIPVTIDENDPLHEVIGSKPIGAMPWHINIRRQRIRGDAREDTAFSPTGTDHVHVPMRFGRMFQGRSRSFEASETGDFIDLQGRAASLARSKQHTEAIDIYLSLTEHPITDFQKSIVLAAAVNSARALKDEELSNTLTAQIPIEAVRATTIMENLLDRRRAQEVLDLFDQADIETWPFWQRGRAYAARGRARLSAGAPEAGRDDLRRALQWTGDRKMREQLEKLLP